MRDDYRKFLAAGAAAGSAYSLCMRQGIFDGGAGGKLGARSGNSLEFMEHRDYMPGDDLRTLDWNVYARTEKLTVKLFREEINPRLDLIIDGSASMALPGTKKAEAVLGLTGIISSAARNASFQSRPWLLQEELSPVPNGSGPVESWDKVDFEGCQDIAAAANRLPGNLYSHALRIVISDLLWMLEPRRFLHKISTGAAAVVLIQVLAREDISPAEYGNIRLEDCETGLSEELHIDAAALGRYKSALNRHQENWFRACKENGTCLISFDAEELVENWDVGKLIKNEIIQVV